MEETAGEHLKRAILRNFPEYFAEYGGEPSKTCMAWGMQMADGWLPIIWSACLAVRCYYRNYEFNNKVISYDGFRKHGGKPGDTLRDLRKRYVAVNASRRKPPLAPFRFTQIKEKMGTLTTNYVPRGDAYIDGIMLMAEMQSYTACEECGATIGILRSNGGWVYTRCKDCADKLTSTAKDASEWEPAVTDVNWGSYGG